MVLLIKSLAETNQFHLGVGAEAVNEEVRPVCGHEEVLSPYDVRRVWLLRKMVSGLKLAEAMELLIRCLQKTATNAEFLKNFWSMR